MSYQSRGNSESPYGVIPEGGFMSIKERNEFLEKNMGLVVSFAKKKAGFGVPVEDLVQEGALGLARAADKYDHSKNARFSTYAKWWIEQFIGRAVISQGDVVRKPAMFSSYIKQIDSATGFLKTKLSREPSDNEIIEYLEMDKSFYKAIKSIRYESASLDSPIGSSVDMTLLDRIPDKNTDVFNSISKETLDSDLINNVLSILSPRERQVIEKRIGLNEKTPKTLEQIGNEFGVTRERIRQIEERAYNKIKSSSLKSELYRLYSS
ncbi:MAG: RNA polymerase sigma factor RpoD/SigA [Nanoarchaeota archaeon]|nr:RNA polymerase sigma factor RpoD/SigA [Nanoarchaeota archaeon]